MTTRATITDVARAAGVSVGTVSKALNGTGQLRPTTRQHVLATAQNLDFHPTPRRRKETHRTYTVGIISTDGFGRFTGPIMTGIEDTLSAGQISVLLCDSRGDLLREQHYVRTLVARRVDGIIVTGRRADARPPVAIPDTLTQTPIVYVLTRSHSPDDLSVVVDDTHGAALAIEHLLATGRRTIAHVTGPRHHLAARERATSVEQTLTTAGFTLAGGGPLWGEWSEASGRHAIEALRTKEVRYDAVFCGSDQIARGVVDALRSAGTRVPDDVAVVGYDNWDVMVEASRPRLTTVDPSLTNLGRTAASYLLDLIEHRSTPVGVTTMPCRLVLRESSEAGSAEA